MVSKEYLLDRQIEYDTNMRQLKHDTNITRNPTYKKENDSHIMKKLMFMFSCIISLNL